MRICCLIVTYGLICLLGGCGAAVDGPELSDVSGTITVNGEPVSGLTVEFQPSEGPPATGTTDESGGYTLTATGGRTGAQLGLNQVRVTGRSPDASDELLSEMAAEQGTTVEELKKLPVIPPKYNEESELEADVQSGSNEFNFDLEV